ncbi:MAG: ATP-binding cassette domain-containing protein [Gemmatimonadales bacterium]
MIALEADGIGVSYGARRVLTSASLRAAEGRVTALIGRNGVGKTSLLRVAVGLQRAEHGLVRLHGRTVGRPRLATLARAGLFFLPARQILEPFMPLGRQLEAVGKHYGGPDLEEIAGRLGLTEIWSVAPCRFSGGEQRRAELGLALARGPSCLVVDEPFRGIDTRDIEVLVAMLRGAAGAGAAVVVTGHEIAPMREAADAVVWCVAGTTHEFADAATAWADPQLKRDFLGDDRWPAS